MGRWPARPALIGAHIPGEVAPEPLAAAPAKPTNLEGRGARAETAARQARRAHLSCQGPAAPPRLTHAGATVAQCLSKLLISPGAARRRRRLWPAGEVELPGPRPRNTCCCRRRRGHTQAQHRPLSGHWLAPGSLTSASGRCRVSAANTRARARAPTGARVHPRGHTPLPRQAGQVSRGHQQVGEVPPQVPGDPGLHCSGVPPTLVSETSHWIPKAGSGHSQHAHQASSAPARLPTAFRAPRTACATKQTPRGVSGQTHVCWRPPGGKLFRS